MGLIQVMNNLADPARLGEGIAVAFVATVYGVGLANLVFIPAANKLKALIREQSRMQELVAVGLAHVRMALPDRLQVAGPNTSVRLVLAQAKEPEEPGRRAAQGPCAHNDQGRSGLGVPMGCLLPVWHRIRGSSWSFIEPAEASGDRR